MSVKKPPFNSSAMQIEKKHPKPDFGFAEIFWIFLKLGVSSFGGPIAHLGYFHKVFVDEKRWFSSEDYAEIVSLCQFLPGPTSSQVGMSIGLRCGGIFTAFAAWLGFTLPSALIMIVAGYGILSFEGTSFLSVLYALKLLAAAVILDAVISMSKSLTPDWTRKIIALFAATILVIAPSALMQISVLFMGVIIGIMKDILPNIKFRNEKQSSQNIAKTPLATLSSHYNTSGYSPAIKQLAPIAGTLFFVLLCALPIATIIYGTDLLKMMNIFFQSGALVFGGGHVVLPLLQSHLVPTGLISHTDFMAGYGIAQAIPGPLFSFAAYLGVFVPTAMPAWITGILCLIIIFLPAILLVLAVIPIWENIKDNRYCKSGLYGVNAVVVGLLLAAFINPILFLTVKSWVEIALIMVLYIILHFGKLPIWLVIMCTILSGYLWSLI
ncbi:chromate efflux transporter [Alphaproteobacteria bacterium]|nr:chromate efflux transporter [Alphaproteobacteria bacterium]